MVRFLVAYDKHDCPNHKVYFKNNNRDGTQKAENRMAQNPNEDRNTYRNRANEETQGKYGMPE